MDAHYKTIAHAILEQKVIYGDTRASEKIIYSVAHKIACALKRENEGFSIPEFLDECGFEEN